MEASDYFLFFLKNNLLRKQETKKLTVAPTKAIIHVVKIS